MQIARIPALDCTCYYEEKITQERTLTTAFKLQSNILIFHSLVTVSLSSIKTAFPSKRSFVFKKKEQLGLYTALLKRLLQHFQKSKFDIIVSRKYHEAKLSKIELKLYVRFGLSTNFVIIPFMNLFSLFDILMTSLLFSRL